MKVPVIVGGVARNADLSVIIGGVEKKVYDAYVIVGGAAKLFYKRAVEWTYQFSTPTTYPDSYSNNAESTLSATNSNGNQGKCYITYTFREPFVLKSGQTISIGYYASGNACDLAVSLNDSSIFSDHFTFGTQSTATYTAQTDITVNKIICYAYPSPSLNTSVTGTLSITINLGDGSFLLNNSGTSET